MVLSALDKIVQKLESWYDLLTAIDKVGVIDKLEVERESGVRVKKNEQGAEVLIEDLVFSYTKERKIFDKINLNIAPGSRSSLVGVSGSGKTSLAYLISGLHQADEGNIVFNGMPIKSVDLIDLRNNIALVSDFNEIFTASVQENITLNREVSDEELEKVINLVELQRDIKQYPQGLQTQLQSEGRNISLGQRQRILLARSIINSPQLLILDEAFGGMDERTKLKIIENIFDPDLPWTISNITHDAEVVAKTEDIYLLEKGVIKEEGHIDDLTSNPESSFSTLFPELRRMVRRSLINNESLDAIRAPYIVKSLAYIAIAVLIGFAVFLFLPWRQTVTGEGVVTVFSPMQRPQNINSQIDAKISKWHVYEGRWCSVVIF